MNWIEELFKHFWTRVRRSAGSDDSSLAIARIVLAGYMILVSPPHYAWLHQAPPAFFNPPPLSIGYLFADFPPIQALKLIDLLILIGLLGMLFGIRTRWCGVTSALLIIVGSTFQYSFGKIDHSIMVPAMLLGLSFTNCGTDFALLPDRKVRKQQQDMAMAILAVALAFGMFTAGAEKAWNWIDFDSSQGGFLRWFYNGYFNLGRTELLAPWVLIVPPPFFESFDWFAVLLELSPFIALLSGKRWWELWLLVACSFHLGNTLLLNISFANYIPVYLCFLPLNASLFMNCLQGIRQERAGKTALYIGLTAFSLYVAISYAMNGRLIPLASYFVKLLSDAGIGSVWPALLWSLAIALAFQCVYYPIRPPEESNRLHT